MSGIFEHLIEDISDIFPDGVAIRFDDHTSSDIRIFCHVGNFDDVIVSFTIIFSAGSYLISHDVFRVGNKEVLVTNPPSRFTRHLLSQGGKNYEFFTGVP